MKPKFSIEKKGRLFITDKWICNGHWAVTRQFAEGLKEFKPILNLKHGRYEYGAWQQSETPVIESIIPDYSSFAEIICRTRPTPVLGDDLEVIAFDYEIKDSAEKVRLADNYAALSSYANALKGKNALRPVIMFDGQNNVCGIIMPLRK